MLEAAEWYHLRYGSCMATIPVGLVSSANVPRRSSSTPRMELQEEAASAAQTRNMHTCKMSAASKIAGLWENGATPLWSNELWPEALFFRRQRLLVIANPCMSVWSVEPMNRTSWDAGGLQRFAFDLQSWLVLCLQIRDASALFLFSRVRAGDGSIEVWMYVLYSAWSTRGSDRVYIFSWLDPVADLASLLLTRIVHTICIPFPAERFRNSKAFGDTLSWKQTRNFGCVQKAIHKLSQGHVWTHEAALTPRRRAWRAKQPARSSAGCVSRALRSGAWVHDPQAKIVGASWTIHNLKLTHGESKREPALQDRGLMRGG